jgi:hypothetical protein
MDAKNTLMTVDIVLLAVVGFFVVVGLVVSLLAITLTSIRESNGRTPQWPVSWPNPPRSVPQQRISAESEQASVQPHQEAALPPRSDKLAERVSLPQRGDVPPQAASLPRQQAHRR